MSGNQVTRFLEREISESLGHMPVTAVIGPRLSGKTTLVQKFTSDKRAFYTLDDPHTYAAATSNPKGFINGIEYCTIDEVQKVPKLILAIKRSVDSDTRPGRFLLTGSANLLTLPTIPDSLAGRMGILSLLPLSQAEIEGTRVSLLDDLFTPGDVPFKDSVYKVGDLERRVLQGGYPEMQSRSSESARRKWAVDYVNRIIRDIKETMGKSQPDDLLALIQNSAAHSAQIDVYDRVGKLMGFDEQTAWRQMSTLEQRYLIERLPAWFHHIKAMRLDRKPRLHFLDTGLLSAICQIDLDVMKKSQSSFEPLLKSFVFAELRKILTWTDHWLNIRHYRDKSENEIDFIISSGFEAFVGIKVKTLPDIQSRDFAGLRKLRRAIGSSFRFGLVLYTGERILPFGGGLFAVPVSALWS